MRPFPASTRTRLPRRALAGLGVLVLSTGLLAPGGGRATADPASPHPASRSHHHGWPHGTPLGYVEGTHKPQTSDGVIGRVAPLRPTGRALPHPTVVRASWQVAPGVHETVWDQPDGRGPVREYLLTIDYLHPGVHLDTMNAGAVRDTDTVLHMADRAGAVAGVNGDFYDIGDTGAPLGINSNSRRGLLNGRLGGWNSAFYLTRQGRPMIGGLSVHTTIAEAPDLTFTNLNSPAVAPDGIGLYTHRWGTTTGYRITDGQTSHVRMVLVQHGVVVRNNVHLPSSGPIDGQMVVGRGAGARALTRFRTGTRLTLTSQLDQAPRMALTGNHYLIHDGLIAVTDDREMAPRTAIGIDRADHQVLVLVVDGRQRSSRGYTMVEMADEMMDLGADEALNLDGGGSSTMVARHAGSLAVVNSPSDGFQRRVANGFAVSYHR